MERIIIGIDAEQASEVAIEWVIRRARFTEVTVTLVTAFDSLIDDPMITRERQLALAARIRSAHPGLDVGIELAQASIHRALEERSQDADLLVIGSHRTRPIRSLLAGEVSSLIASRAHCPTVIVPDDWTPQDGHIVVGVGMDATSQPAMLFGVREAQRRSTVLKLVHASLEGDTLAHQKILGAAARRLRAGHPHARILEQLVHGRATDALVADSGSAELVVIGTHHREPLIGLILGSVSSHLLRRSPVPVCIVPDTGARLVKDEVGVEHNWAAGIGDADARVLDPLGLGRI
jgi:nucleotide-binding universal stress UspA family protein